MPVLDEDNRLAGLVSRSDLVKPLVRPDSEIDADIRGLLAYLNPGGVMTVQVRAGEVTIAGSDGPTAPLFDHLIRAIPGVISLSHLPVDTDPAGEISESQTKGGGSS